MTNNQIFPALTWFDPETNSYHHQTLSPGSLESTAKQPLMASQLGHYLPTLNVKLLHPDATIPTRSNQTDAGLDLYALESVTIPAGHQVKIRTGIAVQFAPGLGLFLWDRSGLAAKHNLHRVAGVIDASYRGEILVVLRNFGDNDYQIGAKERIVQAVLAPVILPRINVVDELPDSDRGGAGFGSTGK